MSTIKVTNVDPPTAGNAVNINGLAYPTAGPLSNRNKIINGDMRIDQRNAGASLAVPNDTVTYTLDRWNVYENTAGAVSVQRSTTAPSGFTNSALITITTADSSIAAGDIGTFRQYIEGFNIADLAWGTASAKTVTVSFWIRSSLTGTFGGALQNSAGNRSYPFSYTINSANTWEQKIITIAGDTTGTWSTDNTGGIGIFFSLCAGSTYTATAGSWAAGNYWGATGQVQPISTLNATIYITGVQLEVGSVATPFEHRSYGDELRRCQRYFEVARPMAWIVVKYNSSQSYGLCHTFVVEKRANPSVTPPSSVIEAYGTGQGAYTGASVTTAEVTTRAYANYVNVGTYSTYFCYIASGEVFTFDSEL